MPTVPPSRSERVFVIDEINMVRIWLEEKLAGNELTPQQADAKLVEYENDGKLTLGPLKDTAGSAKLVYKLAHDVKSWRGVRLYFTKGKTGDLVIIKGWPAGRKLLPGTRYKVTNPKIVELQIGKPGLRAAARESARFGVVLVVAVDVADYFLRDHATFGQLLGKLTVDVPSVVIASAAGAVAGSFVASTSVAGLAFIGTLACGPFLVALVVGVVVGVALYKLDEYFHLSDRLGEAYDQGLTNLGRAWQEIGVEAEQRYKQLQNSRLVHDLSRDAHEVAAKLGRESDLLRWRLTHL